MSYSDDLDWLARNANLRLAGNNTHIAKKSNGVDYSVLPSSGSGVNWCSVSDVQLRRAELQNKPSWVGAPEWAQWVAQHESGYWAWGSGVPNITDHTWAAGAPGPQFIGKMQWSGCVGEVIGDWRDTLERRPEQQSPVDMAMSIIGADSLEPEQELVSVSNETVALEQQVVAAATGAGAEPDANTSAALIADTLIRLRDCPDHFSADELADLNKLTDAELTKRDERVCGGQRYIDAHWFERGELPPVGVVCEAATEGCKYERCEILAYHKGQVALRWFEFNDGCLDVLDFDGWSFRPIRTERDEAIEAMKAHCPYPGSWETTYRLFAEALYDAGYRAGGSE